jgi:hypothetical protein
LDSESAADTVIALVDADQLKLKAVKRLDRLMIELRSAGHGDLSVHSPLDFVMLREALAAAAGTIGFTESSSEADPRMERARAALLAPSNGAELRYAAVIDSSVRELGP